eukprot:TRINITY_DN1303_c0_g1_i1.p1 TRINITY_DN1303_c0_g1~~TRINITY_DN1303_c0_g1_i1.p1  ORF type:complete len:127 (-),score=14.91 TRINITY_DN1303_c0_g1_i1:13-393(-)
MLNLDYSSGGMFSRNKTAILENNLVEIGTGEGKSITLALTAILLALFGFDIYCACYSSYLSERDSAEFKWMFDILSVSDYIHYGTFNNLSESIINVGGDLRKRVGNLIRGNDYSVNFNGEQRPKSC